MLVDEVEMLTVEIAAVAAIITLLVPTLTAEPDGTYSSNAPLP